MENEWDLMMFVQWALMMVTAWGVIVVEWDLKMAAVLEGLLG